MVDVATIAFYLGVIAYSVAATLFFLDLARRDGSAVRAQWAPRLLALGAVLHATHVVTASLLSRVCPIDSLHFALSFTALIAVAAYLLLRERLRLYALGAFVAPIALTFLIGAQFVGQSNDAVAGVSRTLLLAACAVEAADVVLSVVVAIARPGNATVQGTLLDTGLPGAVSALLIAFAVFLLLRRRLQRAMNVLEWAIAVQLLFTQVVVFNREQWSGLIGFGASLLALWTLLLVRRAVATTRPNGTT